MKPGPQMPSLSWVYILARGHLVSEVIMCVQNIEWKGIGFIIGWDTQITQSWYLNRQRVKRRILTNIEQKGVKKGVFLFQSVEKTMRFQPSGHSVRPYFLIWRDAHGYLRNVWVTLGIW